MFDLKEEASGCLNCPNARCQEACPLNVNIPKINQLIKDDKIDDAFNIDFEDNPLGLICGIVCPHEKQCEGNCIKGMIDNNVKIGKIEEMLWMQKLESLDDKIESFQFNDDKRMKVAIVGGGPAGIASASYLLRNGVDVTIYEREDFLGGILIYGIPDFRLNKELVNKNIHYALTKNVKANLEIKYNSLLVSKQNRIDGYNLITLEELEEEYDFVFLAIGLGKSKTLKLQTEANKEYILNANDFLRNDMRFNCNKVVVIGGGNVAIDSARKANKSGADVTIIYRRRREDMPANNKEIEEAIEEGVKFIFTTKVIEVQKSDSKEFNLELTLDNESKYSTDYLIEAIGTEINKNYFDNDIEFTENDYVKVDENLKIENKNVYIGGDLLNAKSTVAHAVYTGLKVAKQIVNFT